MKIKLSESKELFVKSKTDLIKHKKALQEEDKRKQKIISDLNLNENSEPELHAFAHSVEVQMTPPEEYQIIDEAVESW